ncbi:MAG: hypothetical protein OIF34_10450, partial [Porticoccaceae bacterium]|nr:hypothetical protein [Porticoccaceae bacterium]
YYLLVSAIYFTIFGLVSVFMWFLPLKVSEWLLPKSVVNKEVDANIPYASLLALSLVIVGIYTLSFALPDLVHNIVYIQSMNNMAYGDALGDPNTVAMLAATIAEVAMGLLLVLGSAGLSGLIKRLRSFRSS